MQLSWPPQEPMPENHFLVALMGGSARGSACTYRSLAGGDGFPEKKQECIIGETWG